MSPPSPAFRLATPADAAALGEFMSRNFLDAYGDCSTPENVQAAVVEYYGLEAQQRQIADPRRPAFSSATRASAASAESR